MASDFLRLGARRAAIEKAIAHFPGPRGEALQAFVGVGNESKAGFKGLQKDPEACRFVRWHV